MRFLNDPRNKEKKRECGESSIFFRHEPDDLSPKVPKRTRTTYTYTKTPPKWILRLMKDMKILDDNDPKLIIEKPLDLNDIDPLQNRLSIPFDSLVTKDFLNCHESRILEDKGISNEGRIGVGTILVDQRTEKWNVVLKKCVVTNDESGTSLESFVVGGEWSNVVKANGLRDDDKISLWSFRRNGILFLALDFAGDAINLLE